MKNKKIIFALVIILLCGILPVNAKQKKDDESYKLAYLNLNWWKTYKDDNLINYMQQAYNNNQDLKMSALKTKQAEQVVKESFAAELPHIGFAGNYFRDFQSSNVRFGDILINDYKQSNFVLPLTMTYEIDIWGENHLITKSLKKQVEIMKQDERATYIALTSALASEYFNLIKLDKLIQNQEKLVELQKKIAEMTEVKYNNGLCSVTEYLVEKQLYTQFQELLDIYANQRDTIGRQLVVLVGDRNLADIQRSNYDTVSMPQIPESIAAECIQNRPDLLKTEEYIQKIGIDVKVARRDFLPKFTLYGQAGFNAYSLSNIFGSHTFKALAGVMPSLDLFTGGAKIAHLRYSKLEYEKAQQMYEKTILTSLQEVNDSLSSAIKSRKNLDMSSERNSLEKDKYQLMLRKKEIGALSDLDLLRAEENLILADKDEASNKINYIISTINIYKAVGGTDYMQYAENI